MRKWQIVLLLSLVLTSTAFARKTLEKSSEESLDPQVIVVWKISHQDPTLLAIVTTFGPHGRPWTFDQIVEETLRTPRACLRIIPERDIPGGTINRVLWLRDHLLMHDLPEWMILIGGYPTTKPMQVELVRNCFELSPQIPVPFRLINK